MIQLIKIYNMLISSIIKIIIGWFVLEKMPGVVGAKDLLATIIKIIGVIVLISGLIDIIHIFISF